MIEARPAFCDKIFQHFGDRIGDGGAGIDMHNIEVGPENVLELCRFLKETPELSFDFLSDLCGGDDHPDTPRPDPVYPLSSLPPHHRERLK